MIIGLVGEKGTSSAGHVCKKTGRMRTFRSTHTNSMTTTLAILLAALAQIETGGNDRAVGKAGEISRYQLKRDIWHVWTRQKAYAHEPLATTIAVKELNARVRVFRLATRREPTPYEVYALWNAPGQFERVGYQPKRLSKVVQERCRRFQAIVDRMEEQQQMLLAQSTRKPGPALAPALQAPLARGVPVAPKPSRPAVSLAWATPPARVAVAGQR